MTKNKPIMTKSQMINKIAELHEALVCKTQECVKLRTDIKDIADLLDLDTGEEYNFGNIEISIKGLKQECEKIKNWVKSKMFYTDCVNWFERFVYAFDDWQTDLQKQHYQLKAENEELKNTINEAKNSGLDLKSFLISEAIQKEYEEQIDQLKITKEQAEQKLEKIREYCNTYPQNSIGFKKNILQIIGEVENGN